MLGQRYSEQTLKDHLIPREHWKPFAAASDRAYWEGQRMAVRQAHIAKGEARRGCEWTSLPATRFLDFVRDGNRTRYEALSFERRRILADLAVAECMEGQGRFLDDIVNGIWHLCEESFWGIPAHVRHCVENAGLPDIDEPVVDLFAAETAALLAWTAYLLEPQLNRVSPLIVRRIERETQQRILTPLLEREDFFWMGFSGRRIGNWNPWIVSNWLATALVTEKNEDRRRAAVWKAMRTLDHFIDRHPADGACDEGPSYWGRAGGGMYDCLEWLHSATAGRIDLYDEPLVREIGKYIYRAQIADLYFVNFADAPALLTPDPGVCYGYGRRIGDPDLMALGAWAAERHKLGERGVGDSLGRQLATLARLEDILATEPRQPLPRDVFLETTEIFAARDRQGSPAGLFVAAKGGHNAEGHNHNDIGHALVYVDGKPVLVDAGVETYTARTFGPDRYEIWTMRSGYHTLPTVNGRQQIPGELCRVDGVEHHCAVAARDVSCEVSEERSVFRLDLAHAYPPEARIRYWRRTVTLDRGRRVTIADEYDLEAVTGPLTINVMTACRVETATKGRLALKAASLGGARVSGEAMLNYDADTFEATIEPIPLTDCNLSGIWGEKLTRIVFAARKPETSGTSVLVVESC